MSNDKKPSTSQGGGNEGGNEEENKRIQVENRLMPIYPIAYKELADLEIRIDKYDSRVNELYQDLNTNTGNKQNNNLMSSSLKLRNCFI